MNNTNGQALKIVGLYSSLCSFPSRYRVQLTNFKAGGKTFTPLPSRFVPVSDANGEYDRFDEAFVDAYCLNHPREGSESRARSILSSARSFEF